MLRRFSIIIVHRNSPAMLPMAQAVCETAPDQTSAMDDGSNAGSPEQIVAAYPLVQHIRNLLP